MVVQPKTERGDYEYKKEKALAKVAETLEECLEQFQGEENNRIREDIANYTIGYLGGFIWTPYKKIKKGGKP